MGRALIIGGIGILPAGSLVAQLIGEFWRPQAEERVRAFVADLDRRLRDLEEKRTAPLGENAGFLDYVVDIIPEVAKTTERARHEVLRNALLNTAIGQASGSARTQHYRELIRRFTTTHMRVLHYLHSPPLGASTSRINPREVESDIARLACAHVPEFAKQEDLVRVVTRDLRSAGLLVFPETVPTVLGPGQEKLFEMRGSRLTELGLGFLQFISDPTALGT